MDLQHFNDLVCKIHAHSTLSASEKKYIRDELPGILKGNDTRQAFKEYAHPAGVLIRGAPAHSFLKAYTLLLGKQGFGTRKLIGHPYYDDIEYKLTLFIMRSYFERNKPKGYFCCKTCSMAVFPLLAMDRLHLMSGGEVAGMIRPRLEARDPVFTKGIPEKLLAFTLGFTG